MPPIDRRVAVSWMSSHVAVGRTAAVYPAPGLMLAKMSCPSGMTSTTPGSSGTLQIVASARRVAISTTTQPRWNPPRARTWLLR